MPASMPSPPYHDENSRDLNTLGRGTGHISASDSKHVRL